MAAAPGALEEWEWVKWLPHNQHGKQHDGAGSRRLIASGLGELELLLADELAGRQRFTREAVPQPDQPHLVVVLDGAAVPQDSLLASADGVHGVTVIEVVPGDLDEPTGHLVVTVGQRELLLESPSGASYSGRPTSSPPGSARRWPASWRRTGSRPAATTSRCSPTWTSPI